MDGVFREVKVPREEHRQVEAQNAEDHERRKTTKPTTTKVTSIIQAPTVAMVAAVNSRRRYILVIHLHTGKEMQGGQE